MANASSTPVVDSTTTTNAPLPLHYGYVWGTGKRGPYFMLQNTGNSHLDFTRVGIWFLGEGEMDGCHELWINDQLVWTSEWADPTQFHFHRGCDAVIGSGLNPYSIGPDQGVDSFWSSFPSAEQPLAYTRVAYYAIKRKQPIQNQTNTHQNDPTQWTDINPIGLWRGMRVRIFDGSGNMTGYAFTTNPAWQIADAILRRKIYPEYNITFGAGIDDISDAARARFNWESFYEAAQYFDTLVTFGQERRRRFAGNFSFAAGATLAAILEQMLKSCRSYIQETAGQIYLLTDKPRASIFTFSREHVAAGSLAPSDVKVNAAGNQFVGKFRDLLVPAAAQIASITCADHHNPVVTTEGPHCLNKGDRIAQGGTGTRYDGTWTIASVPNPDAEGHVYQYSLVSKGSNYPASVGAGGVVGLLYSRFKERAPSFDHRKNQLARGMVGLGLTRQLNRIKVEYDFNVSTFDQVSRLVRYERDRSLGLDESPYVTPKFLTLRVPLFSRDAAGSGRAAIQVQAGDHITIDDKASFAYAGEYEVLEPVRIRPHSTQPSGAGNSIQLTPDARGGEIEFSLGPYDESVFYDSTDPLSAGWSNVPGSDPGNDSGFVSIALFGSGVLAFFTGTVASGATFDLPSTGFNPENMLAWVGPQGYVGGGTNPLRIVSSCDVDANRLCTLDYFDSHHTWHGDMGFACATWIGPDSAISKVIIGGITYQVFTLAGGEVVCFGKGVVGHGGSVGLPAGFAWTDAFAVAYPHDGYPDGGNNAHFFGAYVDASHDVNCSYKDGSGHVWHGTAVVLVFAWENNSGTVTTRLGSGVQWMFYNNSDGFTLGVGLGSNMAHGTTFVLPPEAGAAESLQTICGSHEWDYPDNGHHTHGINACYLDGANNVVMLFGDNAGNTWAGTADVLALFYEPTGTSDTSAGGISVIVSPTALQLALSGTAQFTAYVTGTTDTVVEWSVEGIAGGNSDVGTIDATGLYTAPATAGTFRITATSHANLAAFCSTYVMVGTGGINRSPRSDLSIVITPFYASISSGGDVQFTATLNGVSGALTWSVDGTDGGDPFAGFVDSSGLYSAGSAGGFHRVAARLVSDSTVIGSATVSVSSQGVRILPGEPTAMPAG